MPSSGSTTAAAGGGGEKSRKTPRVSSALKAVDIRQEPPPLIIGERLNTQGSKKAKELVLSDDLDGLVELARAQVEDGAHCLDVCVATTERSDELEFMRKLVKRLSLEVEAPLVIDSTDPKVIEAAVEQIPGRPIINSINLEGDGSRFHALAPLMARYGLPAVAMCIGPGGMAKTAQEKVETAQLLFDTGAKKYGLEPWQFIFDVLTFTLATGEAEFADSAKHTLEGIRLVKQRFPDSFTTLGLSNVSFGLPPAARKVVNSVFLYHAIKAGLDTVIINPRDIIAYPAIDDEQKKLAEDLIFNRHPGALADLIAYFEKTKAAQQSGTGRRVEVDPSWDPDKKCHFRIVNRLKEGTEADVVQAIASRIPGSAVREGRIEGATKEQAHEAAVQTLNEVLLPAMKEVGDRFGAGELILPFVLKSAECMKAAVAELEKYLIKQEGISKGKLVLCTVYGDVHDIGKSLVNTILSNNGYTVFDLGKQVPASVIIDKAVEVGATAIGLSALLVSTSKQMPLIVNELQRRGLHFPVLIGGAAINRRFGRRILFTDSGAPYDAGVFYCKDAFEGLATIEQLIDPAERGDLIGRIIAEAELEVGSSKLEAGRSPADAPRPISSVQPLASKEIPIPPFWGSRVIRDMPLEMVFQHLDVDELYRLQWGAKNTHGDEWLKLRAEFDARLDRMKRDALRTGYLRPQAVYGYFPAQSTGNSLIVYDPIDHHREVARFEFPRQAGQDNLCLADYFAPIESGVMDVVAFQVVTVGHGAAEKFQQLQNNGDYAEAYFVHGLGVETAEATADYVHRHVRRELSLDAKRGKRYSWGYPACPEMADHQKVFALLPQVTELGLELSAAYQLIPEQSTAAIVVHHPMAKYYSVGVNRVEQLMA